jgi:hypothetical protein
MNEKEEILNMEEGKPYYFNMCNGGGAEIWKINGLYFLFEVPLFGGMPRYYTCYGITAIDEMIKTYKSWT